MTVEFICELLAEWFDSPCNYSPMDDQMFKDNYCESHCGKVTDKECWKKYFEKMWADRKIEPQREPKYAKIIEAYSQGFKDGADAVKSIKDEPRTDCDNCIYLHCDYECGDDEPQTERSE